VLHGPLIGQIASIAARTNKLDLAADCERIEHNIEEAIRDA
jgi:hypothetical protein